MAASEGRLAQIAFAKLSAENEALEVRNCRREAVMTITSPVYLIWILHSGPVPGAAVHVPAILVSHSCQPFLPAILVSHSCQPFLLAILARATEAPSASR